jgi:hypothetical protein
VTPNFASWWSGQERRSRAVSRDVVGLWSFDSAPAGSGPGATPSGRFQSDYERGRRRECPIAQLTSREPRLKSVLDLDEHHLFAATVV